MPSTSRRSPTAKSTRRGILDQLKINGPNDPKKLGSRIGVSAMAIRQHLYALRRQRLVTFRIEPRPVGRPAKIWRLAPAAEKLFPDRHSDLCVGLLDALLAAFGEKGLDRAIGIQTERQAEQISSSLAPKAALSDRLASLVKVRTEQGYLAELHHAGADSFLVIENHCPIRSAAEACPGLCDSELRLFRSVLGMDSVVERREHMLAGDRRCAYLVRRRESLP